MPVSSVGAATPRSLLSRSQSPAMAFPLLACRALVSLAGAELVLGAYGAVAAGAWRAVWRGAVAAAAEVAATRGAPAAGPGWRVVSVGGYRQSGQTRGLGLRSFRSTTGTLLGRAGGWVADVHCARIAHGVGHVEEAVSVQPDGGPCPLGGGDPPTISVNRLRGAVLVSCAERAPAIGALNRCQAFPRHMRIKSIATAVATVPPPIIGSTPYLDSMISYRVTWVYVMTCSLMRDLVLIGRLSAPRDLLHRSAADLEDLVVIALDQRQSKKGLRLTPLSHRGLDFFHVR